MSLSGRFADLSPKKTSLGGAEAQGVSAVGCPTKAISLGRNISIPRHKHHDDVVPHRRIREKPTRHSISL